MTWTTSIQLDGDKRTAAVGVVSATWTDTRGSVTHQERLAVNLANRDAFIQRAIATRNEWGQRRDAEMQRETNLLTALEAADR